MLDCSLIVIIVIILLLALMLIASLFYTHYKKRFVFCDPAKEIKDKNLILKIPRLRRVLENIVNDFFCKHLFNCCDINEVKFKEDFETMMVKLERSLYEFFLSNPKICKWEVYDIFLLFMHSLQYSVSMSLMNQVPEELVQRNQSLLSDISEIIYDTIQYLVNYIRNSAPDTAITDVHSEKQRRIMECTYSIEL